MCRVCWIGKNVLHLANLAVSSPEGIIAWLPALLARFEGLAGLSSAFDTPETGVIPMGTGTARTTVINHIRKHGRKYDTNCEPEEKVSTERKRSEKYMTLNLKIMPENR